MQINFIFCCRAMHKHVHCIYNSVFFLLSAISETCNWFEANFETARKGWSWNIPEINRIEFGAQCRSAYSYFNLMKVNNEFIYISPILSVWSAFYISDDCGEILGHVSTTGSSCAKIYHVMLNILGKYNLFCLEFHLIIIHWIMWLFLCSCGNN